MILDSASENNCVAPSSHRPERLYFLSTLANALVPVPLILKPKLYSVAHSSDISWFREEEISEFRANNAIIRDGAVKAPMHFLLCKDPSDCHHSYGCLDLETVTSRVIVIVKKRKKSCLSEKSLSANSQSLSVAGDQRCNSMIQPISFCCFL